MEPKTTSSSTSLELKSLDVNDGELKLLDVILSRCGADTKELKLLKTRLHEKVIALLPDDPPMPTPIPMPLPGRNHNP